MTEPGQSRKPFPWVAAIIGAVVVILAAFALGAFLWTGRTARDAVDKAIAAVPEIARNFKTDNITHTFQESIPTITSTKGDILEVASFRSVETFKRSDEKRIAWDWVYLGTTVVEIRVPVTFRYHVRLSDPWQLASRDQVCLVLAPPVRPSLPPAIDTTGMEKRAESGWARFDKNVRLDELERSLTGLLEQRAMDDPHQQLVRDACRKSVAEFVRNWLMREQQWRSDRFTAIIVAFPDEVTVASDRDLLRLQSQPTVRLEPEALRPVP
jgi:hypothetical protein